MSLRRFRELSVLALLTAVLSIFVLPQSAFSESVSQNKPTVSSFAASPDVLSASGGSVTLEATVTNAVSCEFSSDRSV